jgi:GT2 family glycosyltransferase
MVAFALRAQIGKLSGWNSFCSNPLMSQPLSDLIAISIPTKDRWDDLEITLSRLQQEGLDALETVVIDDGSTTPMPADFAQKFPWVRFVRSEISQSAYVQRNRMAQLLSKPFILGIDDDSFPIAGDLAAASTWLIEHPKVAALAFHIIFKNETPPADSAQATPFLVRDYIGCGTLIRRELFLELGGYEENFGFYLEEPEYCLRAMQQGYIIESYPAVVVQHNLTPVARNQASRTRSLIHKETLMALWFYPHPQSYIRALSCLPAMLVKQSDARKYWRPLLAGWTGAFFNYFFRKHHKQRLTPELFRHWKSLPMAVDCVMGVK